MPASPTGPHCPAWQRLLNSLDLGAGFVFASTLLIALLATAVLMTAGCR